MATRAHVVGSRRSWAVFASSCRAHYAHVRCGRLRRRRRRRELSVIAARMGELAASTESTKCSWTEPITIRAQVVGSRRSWAGFARTRRGRHAHARCGRRRRRRRRRELSVLAAGMPSAVVCRRLKAPKSSWTEPIAIRAHVVGSRRSWAGFASPCCARSVRTRSGRLSGRGRRRGLSVIAARMPSAIVWPSCAGGKKPQVQLEAPESSIVGSGLTCPQSIVSGSLHQRSHHAPQVP